MYWHTVCCCCCVFVRACAEGKGWELPCTCYYQTAPCPSSAHTWLWGWVPSLWLCSWETCVWRNQHDRKKKTWLKPQTQFTSLTLLLISLQTEHFLNKMHFYWKLLNVDYKAQGRQLYVWTVWWKQNIISEYNYISTNWKCILL